MSDRHTAAWDSSDRPELRRALQDIEERDQTAIDRTLEEYPGKRASP